MELAGTSQQTIDRIERGVTIFSRHIPSLFKVLGMDSLASGPHALGPIPPSEEREKITLTITVSPRMAKRILALLEDE